MAALNMWLFDLNADVYQGNPLSRQMHTLWRIRKGGWMWETAIGAQGAQTLSVLPERSPPVQKRQEAGPPVLVAAQQKLFD